MIKRIQLFAGHRLFLRVFVYFWIAAAVLFTAYVLASVTLRPAWGFAAREMLPYVGARAADQYESRGSSGAAEYLADFQQRIHLKVYLFTGTGANVTREAAPEATTVLVRELAEGQEIGSRRTDRGVFLGVTARSSSGARYILITGVPRTWIGQAISANAGTWLPFLGTFVIVASIWYWLARQLAIPAIAICSVARQFAAGDLAARVTDVRLLQRRDELAELASEFNRMASQIENLIGNQNRLVGDISHELGSPLARLQLAVALARKQLGSVVQAPLDRIQREMERLDELSQQVLHFMRLESPPDHQRPIRVHLHEFVEELVKDSDFEAAAMSRRVLLGRTAETEAAIYPDLLRSALENVIRNGMRYTAERTAVRIDMLHQRSTSWVQILVRDHGPGVREECLPHLFEPFYRAEPARDRKSGGAGLGLSIARRAIEMHGGTIQARNCQEGGLEVEIRLPVAV